MARGNNQTIPSNTGVLVNTLSRDVRATALVLNPNDGVLYVVLNQAASPQTWDFVVPSQSYAALPGPWESLGLYYVDQSGAARSGNVTVYESDNKIDVPVYQAVGIARLAQVTSMDVAEGTVPGNPGVGILRIWADANGHLHGLQSTGTDLEIVDFGVALGGALTGTLPNPSIALHVIAGGNIVANSIAGWDSLINGSVTNASLANGSVDNNKLGAGAALANLQSLTILFPIGSVNVGTDQWVNTALAAGYNAFPGTTGQIVASVPEVNDLVFANINAEVMMVAPNIATNCGWGFFIDGALYREGPKYNVAAGGTMACPWSALFLVAGTNTLSGGLTAASHTFELRFWSQNGITNGAYMRPASTGYAAERLQVEILVSRR